jgi:hypothetical protein
MYLLRETIQYGHRLIFTDHLNLIENFSLAVNTNGCAEVSDLTNYRTGEYIKSVCLQTTFNSFRSAKNLCRNRGMRILSVNNPGDNLAITSYTLSQASAYNLKSLWFLDENNQFGVIAKTASGKRFRTTYPTSYYISAMSYCEFIKIPSTKPARPSKRT